MRCEGREFQFIFTGAKFINELMPPDAPSRGGGGAVDFGKHLSGLGFVPAAKVCLDVAEAFGSDRR